MAKYLPVCFGTYDDNDPQCNGDPENKNIEERVPCVKYKECGAFTRYLKRTSRSVAEYIKIKDEKGIPKHGFIEFDRFCKRLIKKEQKTKIRKKKDLRYNPNYDKRRDGPSSKAKRIAKVVKAKKAKKRKQELTSRFDKIIKKMSSLLDSREFATTGQVVIPGQLYIFDRISTSGYIGIRCKAVSGRDVPIAVFKFKPWTMAFDVRLPFEVDELKEMMAKITFRKLKPEIHEEGRIKSKVKDVKKFRLELLIQFISEMINDNVLDLPRAY